MIEGRAAGQVIHWTNNYQETLRELGLEDDDIMFPEGPDRGTTVLIDKYIERMRTTLHAWFVNILEVWSCCSLPHQGTSMHLHPRSWNQDARLFSWCFVS